MAELAAHKLFQALRETGDWQKAIDGIVDFAASHPFCSQLWTEAIVREMEVTSLEEIVIKSMLRR